MKTIPRMKVVKTELDYLIECIIELRRIRREDGLAAADRFKDEMSEYFRLPRDMESVFVHDCLLRLADTPAGTSSKRNDILLKQVHAMQNGDTFTLHGQRCIFRYHTGKRDRLRDGFFEYVYEDNLTAYRTLDYNLAWHYLMEGDMELDVRRT